MPFNIERTYKEEILGEETIMIEYSTQPTLKKAKEYAYEECQWESTIKCDIKDNHGNHIEEFRGFFA